MKLSMTDARVTRELAWFCFRSESDFAALALPEEGRSGMKWALVAGGRGSRGGLMRHMPGIGLGGMALRHGAVCRANAAVNAEWLTACPVMLAEKLLSGIAFPVFEGNGTPAGVMLFGRRHGLPYAEADAGWIAPLLSRFIEMVGDGAL